jgi:hypothetical protein
MTFSRLQLWKHISAIVRRHYVALVKSQVQILFGIADVVVRLYMERA